jgi:hypothetical protein
MEAAILVLCDSAKCYQDKMVVVGPFNTLPMKTCPFIHPSFSLAMRLNCSPKDKSGKQEILIDFLNEQGDAIMPQFTSSVIVPDNTEESRTINVALGLLNVRFDAFGRYTIKVTINDFYRELYLYVKQQSV